VNVPPITDSPKDGAPTTGAPAAAPTTGAVLLLGAESALGLAVCTRLAPHPGLALGAANARAHTAPLAEAGRVRTLHAVTTPVPHFTGTAADLVADAAEAFGGLDAIVAVGMGGAEALEGFAAIAAAAPPGCAVILVGHGDGRALAEWTAKHAGPASAQRGVRLNAVSVSGGQTLGWRAWEGAGGQIAALYAEVGRVVRLLLDRDARALVGQTIHVNTAASNPFGSTI